MQPSTDELLMPMVLLELVRSGEPVDGSDLVETISLAEDVRDLHLDAVELENEIYCALVLLEMIGAVQQGKVDRWSVSSFGRELADAGPDAPRQALHRHYGLTTSAEQASVDAPTPTARNSAHHGSRELERLRRENTELREHAQFGRLAPGFALLGVVSLLVLISQWGVLTQQHDVNFLIVGAIIGVAVSVIFFLDRP